MRKRPLNPRFSDLVRAGQKTTTIRRKPWPVGVPIMLYEWTGKAYRSPQLDVIAIMVTRVVPISIIKAGDDVLYAAEVQHAEPKSLPLWQTEGFSSQEDMDAWFRPLVKKGNLTQCLHHFTLA